MVLDRFESHLEASVNFRFIMHLGLLSSCFRIFDIFLHLRLIENDVLFEHYLVIVCFSMFYYVKETEVGTIII